MPYITKFVEDGRGVIQTGEGVLTGDELIAGSLRARAEAEISNRLEYGFADFSAVTEFRATPEDLRRLAESQMLTARLVPRAVVAIVAPTDHVFGMVRMWEAYADATGWTTRVFRDRASAEAWLKETRAQRHASSHRTSHER
jgi:hypothetical protein